MQILFSNTISIESSKHAVPNQHKLPATLRDILQQIASSRTLITYVLSTKYMIARHDPASKTIPVPVKLLLQEKTLGYWIHVKR